jgi:hypothetical protein
VLEVPVGFYLEAGWDMDGEGRFWGRVVGGVGGALGPKKDLKKERKYCRSVGWRTFSVCFLSSEEFESWKGRW